MPKTLGYSEAARLLGGQDSKVVAALEKIVGPLKLGALVGAPAVAGALDGALDVARLGHELVRGLAERRAGLSRRGRTERLEAAHTVLVVTAFFEALAEADLPFRLADLELTDADRTRLSLTGITVDPHRPREEVLDLLRDHYAAMASDLGLLVGGLAVRDRLSDAERDRFRAVLDGVPDRAARRYEELMRKLAADFGEVACWVNLKEHAATRSELRRALAGLERTLEGISTGRAPDERRAALARACRAVLDRPVVESGDVPAGLTLPTLAEAYLPPLFRVAEVGAQPYRDGRDRLSDEEWWAGLPVRGDLEDFLTGYLTSSLATTAPLLALGQPGSGKSVLTRVLAARLPAADFLVVRAPLREVPADGDIQDQIEHAIRTATGERLDWPALARSAGDALPVVLLDGFDELLQATGVSQTDYLIRVTAFQRREADQGRPVAVVVTTRTSVADRARAPEDAVALRLEPFDADRVVAWLRTWNAVNAGYFATSGLEPLQPVTALRHPELAEQPLLLLMLALYDAAGNPLQRAGALSLGRGELYERLLGSFARREVAKHRPDLPERDHDRAVEDELRRLSVVAFAMFNRDSQWVTEPDLDADLTALFGPQPAPTPADLRAPLRAAEVVLGRFFFVHRAQASRDEQRLETYEFLHATFGEFLVARLTWQVLRDVAARDAAATLSLGPAPVDDDLMHALLSFALLTNRAPVVAFLDERAAGLEQVNRKTLAALVLRLFHRAHEARTGGRYAGYLPRKTPVPARHAAYSANLLLLAVCAAGAVRASDLFPGEPEPVAAWRNQAMMWRALRGGWTSFVETFTIERQWEGRRRDVRVSMGDFDYLHLRSDPYWTYGRPPGDERRGRETFAYPAASADALRRKTHFLCADFEDSTLHALEPLVTSLPATLNVFFGVSEDTCISAARALLEAWLLPLKAPTVEERRTVYLRCARIALDESTFDYPSHYPRLLLDRLVTDDDAPISLVAEVLSVLAEDDHLVAYVREYAALIADRAENSRKLMEAFLKEHSDS